MPAVRLSVVIATKDRAPFLERALASLAAQREAPPFETIVVDNGSSDATPEVVAGAEGLDVARIYEPVPNRGAARNRGIARARGDIVVFVDDDVILPPHFLAAHAKAHALPFPRAVSGPIINVPSFDARPEPAPANYSRAFFCTCNVSVPRYALRAVGGFDESFALYGWEDTDLGVRLRGFDVARTFAWDAYLWHVKPPHHETLEAALAKTLEKARMAARFVRKTPSVRVRLATGAHPVNLARAALLAPAWALPFFAGVATAPVPPPIAKFARSRLLDGLYVDELRRELAH